MTSVSFFNPVEQEAEIKRRRMMAQQLLEGGKTGPNEMVGGQVVAVSPLEALSKGLQTGIGSYQNARANSEERDLAKKRQTFMADALSQIESNPTAAATTLMQDPNSADLGAKLMFDNMAAKRQEDMFNRQQAAEMARMQAQLSLSDRDFERKAALQREIANIKSGNMPSAVDPQTGQAVPSYSNKPLPVEALKLQQTALDNLSAANSAQQLAKNLSNQVEKGELNLSPTSNFFNNVRNFAGKSTPESTKLADMKTALEKLRNDTLRLNKGVQTEGDAERAMNEVVQSINDPAVFQSAMQRLESINNRAAELQKVQVNDLRANFKVQPYDFSPIDQMGQPQITPGNMQQPSNPATDIDSYLRSKGMNDQQIMAYKASKGIQ